MLGARRAEGAGRSGETRGNRGDEAERMVDALNVRASRVLQASKSNRHDVTLMNVSRKLTGQYKCEVSAGTPSFHTMIQRAKMIVVGKSMSIVRN